MNAVQGIFVIIFQINAKLRKDKTVLWVMIVNIAIVILKLMIKNIILEVKFYM